MVGAESEATLSHGTGALIMTTVLARRLLHLIPTLFGISLISFFLMQLAPGGPVDLMTDMNPHITPAAKEHIRQELGLNRPIPIQYAHWLKRIVTLDFGLSFKDHRPVTEKILERLPATLLLNVLSILFTLMIALPLGFYSAVRAGSWFDKSLTVFVFLGFSLPTYALALVLMLIFGLNLGWLPVSGLTSLGWGGQFSLMERVLDAARHLILPVFVLSITSLAGLSRYARSSMLEVIHQDYIRTAVAKGLTPRRIYGVHAVRNALLPIVTILGLMLPDLIGGGVIIETIFAYPGMGRLGYDAILTRDYNLIMALTVFTAVLTVLGNLAADLVYAWVDPRIRVK
jgi:peptide/nickel transport system permease protein